MKNKIFLAPMLEPNDIAFRILCKKAGADACYTGMTNPLSKKKLELYDKPILQIFCNGTRGIKEFIKKNDSKVSGWDFNLGCPSVVAKSTRVGSYMQGELKKIEEIIREIRKNTKKFFSVKIRKSDYSFEILKIAEMYSDALIIHPRTREQGYSGEPDFEFAEEIKKKSKIPVIYSGNVDENNYKKLLKIFDGVMIGRSATGNPDIFSLIKRKKSRKNFKDYLVLANKYKIPFKQVKLQAIYFTKGLEHATKIRGKLVYAKSILDIEKIYNLA